MDNYKAQFQINLLDVVRRKQNPPVNKESQSQKGDYKLINLLDVVRVKEKKQQQQSTNDSQFQSGGFYYLVKQNKKTESPHESSSLFQNDSLRIDSLKVFIQQNSNNRERSRSINSQTSDVRETDSLNKSIDDSGNTKINQYTVIQTVGRGAVGKAKLVKDEDNQIYIIKEAPKSSFNKHFQKNLNLLEREIAIMKKICHFNIVKTIEVIDDPRAKKIYYVMECMGKGSLLSKRFFKKSNLKEGPLPEDICRYYFRQFLLGLDYLHNCVGVIHRDIKPANLLVSENDELKIADYGMSYLMQDETDMVSDQLGTLAFMAPECWTKHNFRGTLADVWAGGVTLYQMVKGYLPFKGTFKFDLMQQILKEEPDYDNISIELKDLLAKILTKDPEQRITLQGIIEHSWVTKHGEDPLINEWNNLEEVTDQEIYAAFTDMQNRRRNISCIPTLGEQRGSKDSRLSLFGRNNIKSPK